MTLMGCETGLAAQDQWLSGLLTSRPRIVVAGRKLTVVNGSTSISLERRKFNAPVATPTTSSVPRPIPPVPVGEFASSKTRIAGLPADVPVQMTFTTDAVAVRAACNTLDFHLVVIKGASITAGTVGTSGKRCAADRMAEDRALVKFFAGTVGFKFNGADIVVLINGTGQIVLDWTTP